MEYDWSIQLFDKGLLVVPGPQSVPDLSKNFFPYRPEPGIPDHKSDKNGD